MYPVVNKLLYIYSRKLLNILIRNTRVNKVFRYPVTEVLFQGVQINKVFRYQVTEFHSVLTELLSDHYHALYDFDTPACLGCISSIYLLLSHHTKNWFL